MNSSSLSDVAAAPLPTAPAIRSLPSRKESESCEPFGAILEDATASADVDSDSETTAPEKPTEAKEKKKDDAPPDAPLICFCPPPVIDVPTTPAPPTATNAVPAIAIPETTSAPNQTIAPPTNAEPPGKTEPLTQTVAPKTARGAQPVNTSSPRKTSGAIELDPKLFQTVLPESAPPDVRILKTPDAQRPPVTNASHGTLVAQLENRVKNSEKTAEIAPAAEQKMPVRDVLRRAVAEVSRAESFQADTHADQILNANFASEARETIPVKSLQAAHLVESIRTEVTTLRQSSDTTMTVVLRPDSGTQLSLNLSIGRDGAVHAQARCERGDFQTLQAQWPQLQQSLAAHGIRIADLANQNNTQQQNHRSAEAFQNPDRGQSQQQQRNDRDLPSFEDQFTASKSKISSAKTSPQPQPPARANATRRWQSWA